MLSVLQLLKVISDLLVAAVLLKIAHSSATDQLGYIALLSKVGYRFHLNGIPSEWDTS